MTTSRSPPASSGQERLWSSRLDAYSGAECDTDHNAATIIGVNFYLSFIIENFLMEINIEKLIKAKNVRCNSNGIV